MPNHRFVALAGAFALMCACGALQARTLVLDVARLQAPGVAAQALHLSFAEPARANTVDAGTLRIDIGRLDVPALALAGRLEWSCALQREEGERVCAGPAKLIASDGSEHGAALSARQSDRQLQLRLAQGDRHVAVTIPFAGAELSASLQQIPAAWIKAPLALAWPGGELRSGVFDVEVQRAADARIAAQFTVDDLGWNTRDGSMAGQRVHVDGHVDWAPGRQDTHLVAAARLNGGALRLGTLEFELPDAAVEAELDARVRADEIWDVARLAWRDADALTFDASGEFNPSALAPLRSLVVHVERAVLPQMTQRYARGLLAAHGFDALALHGEVAGELTVAADGVQGIALRTEGVDFDDGSGRVTLQGIRGAIDWAARGERPPTSLGWHSARIDGVALSASSARWQSRGGALHLLGRLHTTLLGGELSLRDSVLDPRATGGDLLDSDFAFHGIGFDSVDGANAAADLAADGRVRISGDAGEPRVRLDARLLGGEVLAGPVYVKLPSTAVAVALDATRAGARWQVQALDWHDPGVLDVSARGEIAAQDAQPLKSLQLDLREVQLGPALERYARSWLAAKGYGELSAAGALSGSLAFGGEGIERFAAAARDVNLRDGGGRFALTGLDGSVGWSAGGDSAPSELGWQAIELFRIPFGAAQARLQSRQRAIVLAEPLAIDVLGGQLRLEKLSLQPRSSRGERYAGSFALAGIEMAQLSAALGWPHFGGNLSGGIPEIEFSGDTIELRGGLDLYVFDGHVGVSGVTLERPFGVAPSLGADIHFQNLDLDQVTSAFSFGGMTGRLMGTITGLRLVDWSPVAFDAWLRTSGGGRMSYKAVDDITAIGGGGGLSANLQTMALKLFDTFGYRRLGIRCKLREEVCQMGGIDPIPAPAAAAAGGYTIVEGSGLPRILIVGHRRRVDWPTLVRRLEEATQGQGPVID